ncbi:MAG: hypothetical protein M0036_05900 [Desulfobacteraceae bacterium]|nr:hypothetical protein [Desulfobacteraceae bacterium]
MTIKHRDPYIALNFLRQAVMKLTPKINAAAAARSTARAEGGE